MYWTVYSYPDLIVPFTAWSLGIVKKGRISSSDVVSRKRISIVDANSDITSKFEVGIENASNSNAVLDNDPREAV